MRNSIINGQFKRKKGLNGDLNFQKIFCIKIQQNF
jgi:hypothetical protein